MCRGQANPSRIGAALLTLAGCMLAGGCVHRQFTVTTAIPGIPGDAGAIVQVNGKTVGATPVDVPFTYYGTYRLTILRDGLQTLVVDQPVPAPWYEYFPFEFFSEHLNPWTIRDHRRFHFDLKPLQVPPPEAVLDRSNQLREEGKVTGVPVSSPVMPVTIPAQKLPPDYEVLPTPNPLPPAKLLP
jgi:hypothetical protein